MMLLSLAIFSKFVNYFLCRWLYWSDYDSTVPKIQRISMDGTRQEILHDTSLTHPYGITVDYDSQVLFWTDYTRNRIERSNVNGTSRQLVTTSLINNPYAITYFNGRLYWTDLAYSRILTAAATPSSSSSYLTTTIGAMYGIKVITEERQPLGKSGRILQTKNGSAEENEKLF